MPIMDSMAQLRAVIQPQGGFVCLDQQNKLTTSTARTHFWQVFRRLEEKKNSIAAAERVRTSICLHCGKTLGNTLFNKYIGEKSLKGARFTSANLASLLDAATRHNVRYIDDRLKVFSQNAMFRSALSGELGQLGVSEEDFMSLVRKAVGVLNGDFVDNETLMHAVNFLASVREQLVQIRDRLTEFEKQQPQGAQGLPQLSGLLNGLIGELASKGDILVAQSEQNPFSCKNVRTAVQLIYGAYERLIDKQIARINQELPNADPAKTADLNRQLNDLNTLRTSVQGRRNAPPELQGLDDGAEVTKELMKTFDDLPGKLCKELRRIVPDQSKGSVAREFKKSHVEELNSQQWNVIQRDMQYLGQAGRSVTATSTITPARHIGTIAQSMAQDNLQGVSCGDRGQARHAVNLACTEVSVGGTTLFQGIRHGVNSAYTIKDPAARRQANNARALEIFTAALQSSPALLRQAQAAQPGTVIDLPLLSTSLLTPDFFRRFGGSAERNHLREQCNAWLESCPGGVCQIPVPTANGTKMVTVRPNVVAFNFGVNAGAQNSTKGLFFSWSFSNRYNSQAMAQLFGSAPNWQGGMVGQYLSQPHVSAQDRNLITALRSQIIELWESGDYKKTGEDPYRLPARLAMLGHAMGMMPLFNCKSGKDRTGQMDVACKTLALQIHERGGTLPPLAGPRTNMDRRILHQVAINGGNFEMQRMNTGLAGFKTKHVTGLENLFRDTVLKVQLGLSDHVDV